MSAVSAEPPIARTSTVTVLCSTPPSIAATRAAAASAERCRWPYSTDSAWQAKPRARAIASVTAESMPPETSTTAPHGVGDRSVIGSSMTAGLQRESLQPALRQPLDRRAGGGLDHRFQRAPGGGVVLHLELAVADLEPRAGRLIALRKPLQQRLEGIQRHLVVLGDVVGLAQPVIRIGRERIVGILLHELAEAARGIDVVARAQRLEGRRVGRLRGGLVGRRGGFRR